MYFKVIIVYDFSVKKIKTYCEISVASDKYTSLPQCEAMIFLSVFFVHILCSKVNLPANNCNEVLRFSKPQEL